MRYRKYLGWGVVLCVGLGLVLGPVSLWVQLARQRSVEERIAEAGERLKYQQDRVMRLRGERPATVSGEFRTPEEQAKAIQLAEAKNQERRQAIRKAMKERDETFDELEELFRERARQYDIWPARLRRAIRRYTGR
jgi:hypothetical protein